MYVPTLDQFKQLAERYNLIPVYREITADLETPVSAFLKTARGPYSFLLESVEGGENLARYSFIGTEPLKVTRTGPGEAQGDGDPLAPLSERLNGIQYAPVPGLSDRFHGGAVGYVSYDAVRHFEPRVPPLRGDGVAVPESVFMYTDSLLVFDHVRHRISVVAHAEVDGDADLAYRQAVDRIDELIDRLAGPLPANAHPHAARRMVVSGHGSLDYASEVDRIPGGNGAGPDSGRSSSVANMSRERFEEMIEAGKRAIYEGEVIQVVLSQRVDRRTDVAPFDLYRSLRAINPSPYMFYLDLDEFQVVGASPEMLVRSIDGEVTIHPIAGTRPRGETPEEDARLAEELRTDEKECAEHVMLLDLGRNDVGRVSLPGTVQVRQQMDVEYYSHVMHLVSDVAGRLRPECDVYEALRAGFPAGTLSGAPKVRAMELITELEPDKRGLYGGAVGYFSYGGNMDTCIGIRTVVMKDGVAHMQAGGGVVADSTPEGEYQESLHKMNALQKAIDDAEELAGG